jgi:hypothetical protein
MEIHLSPQAERFVETQLKLGLYGSPGEIIDALIREKQLAGPVPPSEELASTGVGTLQRNKLLALIRECEILSRGSPKDEFSNRDHDSVLYGNHR